MLLYLLKNFLLANGGLGNIDPEKYKQAKEYVDQLNKAFDEQKEKTSALGSILDGISSTIFNVSSSQFFKKMEISASHAANLRQELVNTKKEAANIEGNIDEILGNLREAVDPTDHMSQFFQNFGEDAESALESIRNTTKNIPSLESRLSTDIPNDKINKMKRGINQFRDEINNLPDEEIKTKLGLSDKEFKENREAIISFAEDYKNKIEDSSEQFDKLFKNSSEFAAISDKSLAKTVATKVATGDIEGLIKENVDRYEEIRPILSKLQDGLVEHGDQLATNYKKQDKYSEKLKEGKDDAFDLSGYLGQIADNILRPAVDIMKEFDNAIHQAQRTSSIMFDENTTRMSDLVQRTQRFGLSIQETTEFMTGLSEELRTTNFGILAQAAEDLAAVRMATGLSQENLGKMAGSLMRMGQSSGEVKAFIETARGEAEKFNVSTRRTLENISGNIERFRDLGFEESTEELAEAAAEAERMRISLDSVMDVAEGLRGVESAMEAAAELQLAGGSFAQINPMELLSAAREGPEAMQDVLKTMGEQIGSFNEEGEFKIDPVDRDRLKMAADSMDMELGEMRKMIEQQAKESKKFNLMPDFKFDGIRDEEGNMIEPEKIKRKFADQVDVEGKVKEGTLLDDRGIENIRSLNEEQVRNLYEMKKEREDTIEKQAQANRSLTETWNNLTRSLMSILTAFHPLLEVFNTVFTWIFEGINYLKETLGDTAGSWTAAITMSALIFLTKIYTAGKYLLGIAPKIGSAIGGVFKKMGGALGMTKKVPAGGGGGFLGMIHSLKRGFLTFVNNSANILKGAATLAGSLTMIIAPLVGATWLMDSGAMSKITALGIGLISLATSLVLVSRLSKGIAMSEVIKASIAMSILGVSLIPMAYAAQMFNGIDWETFGKMAAAMVGGVLTMIGIGAMLAGPQLALFLGGVAAIAAAAGSMLLFGTAAMAMAEGAQGLSNVNWQSLLMAGPALMSVAGGLHALAPALAFAASASVTVALLAGSLTMLYAIVDPLATSLELSANSLERMAESMGKLKSSVNNLNLDKLNELKDISHEFSQASDKDEIIEAMSQFAESMGGGTSQGGEGKTRHVIDVKMNGRRLKEVILDDTSKVT